MNEILQNDLKNLATILQKVKTEGLGFLSNIEKIPTTVSALNVGERNLNEQGLSAINVLKEFQERFEPIIVASTGPRYWGFVTGGSTPASIAGDWLATIYDQNTQSVSGEGDASALIEFETIKLLLQLFNLPNDFLGGFVSGATMSNFTCLAVARQWVGKKLGLDIAKDGVTHEIKVLTAVPHSSSVKSLSMLGLGSRNFIKIKVLEGNREAMDIADLEKQLSTAISSYDSEIRNPKSEIQTPFILISSGGTVNTVDFDDFKAIAKLKEKYNFWWHIDAAFGGFAACSEKFKHLVSGWENADSITIDAHKWLNVPYENAFFLVKEKHKLLQVETFQNSNAPYLGDPLENFNFLNFLPENSRRLKALPVWFSLLAYGKDGYRDIVERSVELARNFGKQIEKNPAFELLAPVRLNTVCFTLSGSENQEKVSVFLSKLNKRGKVFMTPTFYNGKKGIRAAFVNWRTTEKDIEIAINEMKNVLEDF